MDVGMGMEVGMEMDVESRIGIMSGSDSGYVLATADLEARADWFSGVLGLARHFTAASRSLL